MKEEKKGVKFKTRFWNQRTSTGLILKQNSTLFHMKEKEKKICDSIMNSQKDI